MIWKMPDGRSAFVREMSTDCLPIVCKSRSAVSSINAEAEETIAIRIQTIIITETFCLYECWLLIVCSFVRFLLLRKKPSVRTAVPDKNIATSWCATVVFKWEDQYFDWAADIQPTPSRWKLSLYLMDVVLLVKSFFKSLLVSQWHPPTKNKSRNERVYEDNFVFRLIYCNKNQRGIPEFMLNQIRNACTGKKIWLA